MPHKYAQIVRPKFNGLPEEWARKYESNIYGIGNYPKDYDPQGVREDDIAFSLGAISLLHFGFPLKTRRREILNRGVDVAVDYFCGDWWKSDKDSSRMMDKSKKRRGLYWFSAFMNGLLLGLLSQRWEDVTRICDWVESDLVPEEYEEEQEPELGHVYKCIASSFRTKPMDGSEKLEKKLEQCHAPRPKLLFNAWQAALSKDSDDYQEAIMVSLKHFKKKFGKGSRPIDWIARHESAIILAAEHLGVKPPNFPIELEAVVITPQSIK